MHSVNTPEELVAMYDGNKTPIAKLYTRSEADELFADFNTIHVSPHYFPVRFFKFIPVGSIIHRLLDRSCGVLIYYLLEKQKS